MHTIKIFILPRLYKPAVLHMKIVLISRNVYFERRRFWNECQVTRSKFNSPMYRASSVPVNSVSSRSWRLELLIVLALSMLGWLWNRGGITAIGVFSGFGFVGLVGEVFRCCAKNPFVLRPSLSVRIPAKVTAFGDLCILGRHSFVATLLLPSLLRACLLNDVVMVSWLESEPLDILLAYSRQLVVSLIATTVRTCCSLCDFANPFTSQEFTLFVKAICIIRCCSSLRDIEGECWASLNRFIDLWYRDRLL